MAENAAYHLAARVAGGQIVVALDDRLLGLRAADGPYLYRAELAGERETYTACTSRTSRPHGTG